jgi:hypothetical protein
MAALQKEFEPISLQCCRLLVIGRREMPAAGLDEELHPG